jgi:hypothetical protein
MPVWFPFAFTTFNCGPEVVPVRVLVALTALVLPRVKLAPTPEPATALLVQRASATAATASARRRRRPRVLAVISILSFPGSRQGRP